MKGENESSHRHVPATLLPGVQEESEEDAAAGEFVRPEANPDGGRSARATPDAARRSSRDDPHSSSEKNRERRDRSPSPPGDNSPRDNAEVPKSSTCTLL